MVEEFLIETNNVLNKALCLIRDKDYNVPLAISH
jgi:hypothetical protein